MPNTFADGNPNCFRGDKAQLATPAGLTEFIAHLSVCRGRMEGSPAEGRVLPQFSSCKKKSKNKAELSTTNIRQLNTICHRYTAGGVRILCVFVFRSQTHSLSVVPRLERRRCCLGGGQGHGRAGGKNLDGGGESQEGERWGMGNEAQQAAPGPPSRRS